MAEKNDISNLPSADLSALPVELRGLCEMLLSIERQRADVTNRQTEVSRLNIEMQERANLRQFDLNMAQLKSDNEIEERRIKTAAKIAFGAMGLFAVPMFLALLLLFFGDDLQREAARGILVYGGISIAGFGFFSALRPAIKAMLKSRENDEF